MGLRLEGLSVTLGKRAVLDEVSARFGPGRIGVVIGPNGAGKSTLARACAGLVGYAGRIAIDGDDLTALPPVDRARRIGYLPQRADLHWPLAVAETVALGRLPWRNRFAASSPADREAIDAAMAAMAITDFADRRIDQLSGGERARVLLARVLAGTPRWLIADEPLASLDPAHQLDLLARLRALADSGAGVVLVLHDLHHAARIADDVLLLKDGRVLGQGAPAEILAPAPLRTAFGVDFELVAAQSGAFPLAKPIDRS